jgi:glutaminase
MASIDYQAILNEIYHDIQPHLKEGKVADYIPALARVNPDQFAMSITLLDGNSYHVGSSDDRFSIQSISKVFTFTQALKIYRKKLYDRVGIEPSGNPFNSLVQLEYENGKPRNPFINAGAIVITDSLLNHLQTQENTYDHIIEFMRDISHEESITYNEEIYHSEYAHGHRNRSLANLMKSFDNLDNEVDDVVKSYFQHCAIEMSTSELSRSILYLANHGTDPITQKEHLTQSQAKRINAVMLTCGHYDASGDFAFYVGLPGKSGVGGGIVAVVPNVMSIAVFSPRLNSWGNSHAGTKALELFTTKTGYSIF